jgi:hypothetical protein
MIALSIEVPAEDGGEPSVEFSIDPAKLHDAADLPEEQAAVMAAT